MNYPVRWRLLFADGSTLDERTEGASILNRPRNEIEALHLIDTFGEAVSALTIPPGYLPLFYRRRSLPLNNNGARLDGLVFGCGQAGGDHASAKLWLWRNGRCDECPEDFIAPRAIKSQLMVEGA